MKTLIATTAPRRFSTKCSRILAGFKDRLATELANEFSAVNERLIHQVVNEADALASTTLFPALFLPALAEEKVRQASAWAARQREIHDQSLAFAA